MPDLRPGWNGLSAMVNVGEGLRLRQRAGALTTLQPSDAPIHDDHVFVTANGVDLDDMTRRAASARAVADGLEVVDLVPADLPVERALDLLRWTDPSTFRSNRLAASRGPAQALLLSRDVATRVGVDDGAVLGVRAFVAIALDAKRCASATTDLAVSPWLTASRDDPADRWAQIETLFGNAARPAAVWRAVETAALVRSAARRRKPTPSVVAALAAHALHPVIALLGTPLRPRDLRWMPAVRLPMSLVNLLRVVVEPGDRGAEQQLADARIAYDALLIDGVERFLEPRRTDCPLCGATNLRVRVTTPDFLQGKPGTFTLEQCGSCDHIFQNPRLTQEGLDFYYKDFWEGAGYDSTESVLQLLADNYRARAEMVAAITTPRNWLDVGAGHGHFSLLARDIVPAATFDGLDMSESIDEAVRLRWVDQGYRAQFTDRAPQLAGSYDVVSMHHYLEHTREPLEELDAAAMVVRPGGLLLVEVPDPEYRAARLLGAFWPPWAQPQHQHLFTRANLESAITARGFATIEVHTGEAHMPDDLLLAVLYVVQRLAPAPNVPWGPAPTLASRLRRAVVWSAAAPMFALGFTIDKASAKLLVTSPRSNTFRILARRDGRTTVVD